MLVGWLCCSTYCCLRVVLFRSAALSLSGVWNCSTALPYPFTLPMMPALSFGVHCIPSSNGKVIDCQLHIKWTRSMDGGGAFALLQHSGSGSEAVGSVLVVNFNHHPSNITVTLCYVVSRQAVQRQHNHLGVPLDPSTRTREEQQQQQQSGDGGGMARRARYEHGSNNI